MPEVDPRILRAEAVSSRLLLAMDADDWEAYGLALVECAGDCGLNDSVIATLTHTLAHTFERYCPGWQDRTSAALAEILDALAGV